MKKIFTRLLIIIAFIGVITMSASVRNVYLQNKSNFCRTIGEFNENVYLTIDNQSRMYNNEQVQRIINSYLQKEGAKTLNINSYTNELKVCEASDDNGKNFFIYAFIDEKNKKISRVEITKR